MVFAFKTDARICQKYKNSTFIPNFSRNWNFVVQHSCNIRFQGLAVTFG